MEEEQIGIGGKKEKRGGGLFFNLNFICPTSDFSPIFVFKEEPSRCSPINNSSSIDFLIHFFKVFIFLFFSFHLGGGVVVWCGV